MNLAVDVISDVICPWCYIGKRRLENLIPQIAVNSVQLVLTSPPYAEQRKGHYKGVSEITVQIVRRQKDNRIQPRHIDLFGCRLIFQQRRESLGFAIGQ